MSAPEVHLACTRPAHWSPADREDLARMLDAGERDVARRFRFDSDRAAYVIAHAMLKAMASAECGLSPEAIELRHDAKGRPFIAQEPLLHVSLSRSHDAVACAVTRIAPIGVDIEEIDGKPVDAGMLGAFVVTGEPVTTRQFYLQWTALEAFWKSCGTGLADDNPRIFCAPRTASRFDVHLERSRESCAGRGVMVHAYDDCALAVVLRAPVDPDFVLKRTNCASAVDIHQLSRAHIAHERLFAT
jgi:phosphopantetheinyl transferase